jgi:plastocyanin
MNGMLKHRRAAAAGIAALGCAVVVPVATSAAASKPKVVTKKVSVGDDFFKPTKLTIKKKNAINFVWNKSNFDSHNVTLIKGPKGVKHSKFTSITGTIGIHFNRQFLTPGTYHFICTIHPGTMNLTVIVKK